MLVQKKRGFWVLSLGLAGDQGQATRAGMDGRSHTLSSGSHSIMSNTLQQIPDLQQVKPEARISSHASGKQKPRSSTVNVLSLCNSREFMKLK